MAAERRPVREVRGVWARKAAAREGAAAAPGKTSQDTPDAATRGTASARPSAVLEAVARRLEEAPQRVLPTLRLLADPNAVAEAGDSGTIEMARSLNAVRRLARLEEFRAHAYPTSQVRQLLGGLTRQAVALQVNTGKLLAQDIGGRNYFPDWQFNEQGSLPGLTQVLGELIAGGRSVVAADALMRTPLPEEGGRSPADLLAGGEVDKAVHYVAVAGGGH